MFVRIRRLRRRLAVTLIATHRVGRRADGKVKTEHVAALGSAALPEPVDAGERRRFWRELEERFIGLGSRLSADDRRKARAAIHARIPKRTDGEELRFQIDAARIAAERPGKWAAGRAPLRAVPTPSARP